MLGLVALTALTSWVVARISIWLVPVYMSAMALIFAAPRTTRPKVAASPSEGPATDPAEGDEPTAADDSQGPSSIAAESPTDVSDAPGEPAPRPRKRRARARRSAKGASAEAIAAAAQVTWVRVGPGKFVRADVQDPGAEGPPSTESVPDATVGPDAGVEPDANGEEVHPDPRTPEDETTAAQEAPEEPVSFELPTPVEVSEAIAEEHGNAPSTLGEGQEAAHLPEGPDHDDPEPVPVARPSPAPEPVVEAEPVAAPVAPSASIPDLPTTATRGPGSSRPVALLKPPTAETPRLRPVGPVVDPGRLRNVRRGDAPHRLSARNGRGVDVRLRQRTGAIRSRLIRVERDYQPRSPPARA